MNDEFILIRGPVLKEFSHRALLWAWRTLGAEAASGFGIFAGLEQLLLDRIVARLMAEPLETRVDLARIRLKQVYPDLVGQAGVQAWTERDSELLARIEKIRADAWHEVDLIEANSRPALWEEGYIRQAQLRKLVRAAIKAGGYKTRRPREEGYVGWNVEVHGWIVHSAFESSASWPLRLIHSIYSPRGDCLDYYSTLEGKLAFGPTSNWAEITASSADRFIQAAMRCAQRYLAASQEWLAGLEPPVSAD